MRTDITPGATFPDYELPDQTGTRRRLSQIQGNDPMVVVRTVVEFLHARGQDFWSRDAWPLRLLAEVHSFVRSDGQYTRATLQELAEPGRMGPIGCWVTAELLKLINHDATPYFQQLGKRSLTFEATWSDLDIICKGAEKVGRVIAAVDWQPEIFDLLPEHAEELKQLVAAIKKNPDPSPVEVRRVLEILWEPFLRPLLDGSLE